MIKLIVTDIDGTLVEDGANTLPEGMMETIEALIDRGIVFVAASGRSLVSLERLFEPIKEKIYYAACNGTLVGPYRNLMFTENLEKDLLKELLQDAREYEDAVAFLTGAGIMYSDTQDEELLQWLTEGYREDITRVPDIAQMPDDFVKLSIYDRNRRSGETFRPFFEKWDGMVSMATAGAMWLDVYKIGVNKGTAVKKLQELLGISREETLAFGDQQNDIEMLGKAYHSYAIGNALPEVKAAARYVADSNVNGGALKVFRSLL
ncbi:HAD family hydrolase [Qiania dongpingensis]|uniref:HAD family phosphatase n=1 Tax=Qiania dongpingensis TaxID=2763669 RepID=A0A7G9G5T3_9FIRM|nr:HAD family hydrolase [Qiania dongpingensis]QNM06165.1 HAD family phosphatase [Qiania dongpingensis]